MQPYLFGLPMYYVCILTGAGLGAILVLVKSRSVRASYSIAHLLIGSLYVFAGVAFGGKLLHAIQRIAAGAPDFLSSFLYGGYVFYGSLIGCVCFLLLYCNIFQKSLLFTLDLYAYAILLAQAFGRLGCYFAGCCYGIPLFTGSGGEIIRFPSQLAESTCLAIMLVALLLYGRKPRRSGNVFAFYLLASGSVRFVLEFFRGDAARGFWNGLSTSQWIGLSLVCLGLCLACRKQKHP